MPRSVVADAGGVLVFSGALAGSAPCDVEVLALDWTAITVGRFLSLRHEADRGRIGVELGIALAAVDEWCPVRSLVADTVDRAGTQAVDSLDSWSAVHLGAMPRRGRALTRRRLR